MHAIEKIAPVEIARFPEFLETIGARQPLETPDIGIDRRTVERQPVTLYDDRERFDRGEIVPEQREYLPQAIASVPVVAIAPENACDLITRQDVSGGNCQASEQRLGLLATDGQRAARWKARLKTTEEAERECRHGSSDHCSDSNMDRQIKRFNNEPHGI
jgi:hypothetical protein